MINLNIANTVVTAAINTQSAEVQARGTWTFGLRNDYYQLRQFSNAQLVQYSAQTGRSIESDGSFNFTTAAAAYGLTDSLTIGVVFPFARLTEVRTGEILISKKIPEVIISNSGTSQGFSDITLFGQWLVLDNKTHQFSAMFTFGSILPTGAAYVRGRDGLLFPPIDQPGRGTWAPFIGAALTKKINKESLSVNIQFTKGLVGAQHANLGDLYDYNIALVHPLYKSSSDFSLDGILELNGEYYSNTIMNQMKDPDSGGNIIYFTPGLRINAPHGVFPYISIGLPILQTLNGIQSPVRYWFTFGIDISK